MSENTLYKMTQGKIKPCRDAIDTIIGYIINGYLNYDINKGVKLRSWLITNARFAVKKLIYDRKKNKMKILSLDKPITANGKTGANLIKDKFSLENKIFFNELIEYIQNCKIFNERQKQLLIGVYRDNMRVIDLSKELNIHRSYAMFLLTDGIEQLKRKFGHG